MVRVGIGLLVTMLLASLFHQISPPPPEQPPFWTREAVVAGPPLHVAELDPRRPIVGYLGQPLGTCFEIRAVMRAPERLFKQPFEYYLDVSHVNGSKLDRVVPIRFLAGYNVPLAHNHESLHALTTGKREVILTDKQKDELDRGYVGRILNLIAYESGDFRGLPHTPQHLWKHVPPSGGMGFGFHSHLVVEKILE